MIQQNEDLNLIDGTWGDDTIRGTDGADKIYALPGNDVVGGGEGDNILKGGRGADMFVYRTRDFGEDVIKDFDGYRGNDRQADGDKLDFRGSEPTFADLTIIRRATMTRAQVGIGSVFLFLVVRTPRSVYRVTPSATPRRKPPDRPREAHDTRCITPQARGRIGR